MKNNPRVTKYNQNWSSNTRNSIYNKTHRLILCLVYDRRFLPITHWISAILPVLVEANHARQPPQRHPTFSQCLV